MLLQIGVGGTKWWNMEKREIGGAVRPIAFGMRLQYAFEKRNKKSVAATVADMTLLSLAATQQPELLWDEKVRSAQHVVAIVELAYAALEAGAKEAGEPFDYDELEVVGWIDEDPSFGEWFLEKLMDSLPRDKEKEAEAAKKKNKQSRQTTRYRTGMR